MSSSAEPLAQATIDWEPRFPTMRRHSLQSCGTKAHGGAPRSPILVALDPPTGGRRADRASPDLSLVARSATPMHMLRGVLLLLAWLLPRPESGTAWKNSCPGISVVAYLGSPRVRVHI
jgi:hypothetical protein